MKLSVCLLAVALTLFSIPNCGAAGGEAHEIRLSDVPKDAPRFEDYPAKPYLGPNAAPDVRSDPRSRAYRTQLRGWAAEKPNFAGHHILATWGCGTSCTQVALIDARTGKVFHPLGVRLNYAANVDVDLLDDAPSSPRRADFGALRYRADSRLLILFGTPENKAENRGISYFVWENDRMRRIRFVPRAK